MQCLPSPQNQRRHLNQPLPNQSPPPFPPQAALLQQLPPQNPLNPRFIKVCLPKKQTLLQA
jgi:hypothetical protein